MGKKKEFVGKCFSLKKKTLKNSFGICAEVCHIRICIYNCPSTPSPLNTYLNLELTKENINNIYVSLLKTFKSIFCEFSCWSYQTALVPTGELMIIYHTRIYLNFRLTPDQSRKSLAKHHVVFPCHANGHQWTKGTFLSS